MVIIFVGSTVDTKTLKDLPDASVAGNKMQLGFIKGFLSNGINTIGISAEAYGMWKFNKKPVYVKGKDLKDGTVFLYTVSYLNIPVIKQFTIYRAINKKIRYEIRKQRRKSNDKGNVILMVYNTMSIFAGPVINVARKEGCKCVAVVADLPIKKKKSIIRRIEDKRQEIYISKFDGLIPLTKYIADDFAPGKPYCIVEAGCNPSDYQEDTNIYRRLSKKKVVFSGTLNELSGIDLILNAMKYVSPDIELDIYGDGPYREKVENAIQKQKNVNYHGKVSNEEMIQIQSKAPLLVCPRHDDNYTTKYTFPSKLLEYICAGVPVLSNRLKGIPEEYEDYITFSKSEDPKDWADTINTIVLYNNEYYYKKAKAAQKKVLEKKSWKKQSKKVIDFLEEL